MSDRQIVRDIIRLTEKLKTPEGGKIYSAAQGVLATLPPDSQRIDGLTNKQRFERNKVLREQAKPHAPQPLQVNPKSHNSL